MSRARIVLIDRGHLALIERNKNGNTYYVYPGGGADKGESLIDAAKREALEELGVEIEVGEQIAEDRYEGRRNVFFTATLIGGEFGSGTGEEMSSTADSKWGSYKPEWIPIDRLDEITIYPEFLTEIVKSLTRDGN
jgi:8-oxo-dGTP pyrophosphatase MutT (NUDIX family)